MFLKDRNNEFLFQGGVGGGIFFRKKSKKSVVNF